MQKRKLNNRGFTLIETIFTLLLVGVTATLAGMWIVNVANVYIFAKMNADTVGKAQLAITRLTKELQAIQTVNTGATNATQISYTRADASTSVGVSSTVSKSGSSLLLNGDPLTDGVGTFTLGYCDSVTSASPCPQNWSAATSKIIEVNLTLTSAGGIPSTLTKRIAPRNL